MPIDRTRSGATAAVTGRWAATAATAASTVLGTTTPMGTCRWFGASVE
ncbi:hypothetical protein [Streptosporangium sp. NPDC020145]